MRTSYIHIEEDRKNFFICRNIPVPKLSAKDTQNLKVKTICYFYPKNQEPLKLVSNLYKLEKWSKKEEARRFGQSIEPFIYFSCHYLDPNEQFAGIVGLSSDYKYEIFTNAIIKNPNIPSFEKYQRKVRNIIRITDKKGNKEMVELVFRKFPKSWIKELDPYCK